MVLLRITDPDSVDEVLMAVPDDYDRQEALTQAADLLNSHAAVLKIEDEIDLPWIGGLTSYRPYKG